MESKLYGVRVGLKRLGWLVAKFKYIILVLVLIIAVVAVWQYNRHQTAEAWQKANDYYTHADYAKAAAELKHVSMPSDKQKLTVYAQTMLATRQLPKAETAYSKLYDETKDPFAKLVLGNVYNEEKQYDKAAKVYQQLIASNPSYTQAYVNLATVYKLQNDTKSAITIAQQGVKANPNDVVLNELLVSMTMDDKSSATYQTAVADLKKLNPKDPLLEALKE